MPRINYTRTDRIAQMSKQEQLIAQKRQQILEKQRTLQMAKQIAAEATKNSTGENEEEPEKAGALKIPFSNDGSFLENFKKLSEKLAKTTEETAKRPAEEEAESNIEKKARTEEPVLVAIPPPPPPPAPPTPPVSVAIPNALPMEISYATYYAMTQAPTIMPLLQPTPMPPPIPEVCLIETVQALPMMPAPSAAEEAEVQVQAPPENVPDVGANCKVFSENDILPTTVEELVELVADIGDVYEEKLSSRKNELHPSLWFLFDKQSEAYRNYRHMIVARLFKTAGIEHALPAAQSFKTDKTEPSMDDSKYDPADVLDDTQVDEDPHAFGVHPQREDVPIQMQPNYYGDERHFYDDKSTTETDSDTEYVREARKRNLKNLKHKTMNAGNMREDSTSDSDDQFNESSDGKQEVMSDKSSGNSGGRTARQKHRKKSRWGDQIEGAEEPSNASECKDSSAITISELSSNAYSGQIQQQNSRSNPGFLQFVFQSFDTVEVSPESWKRAEEHFRIRLLYEDMSSKIQAHERFASNRLMSGNNDLREDFEEDKRLNANKMEAVLLWINEITKFYERSGSPRLEDFLLRDEFENLMNKFQRTNDCMPSFEEYKKFKLEQAKIVSTNSRGEYSSSDPDLRGKTVSRHEVNRQAVVQDDTDKNTRRRKSRWGDQVGSSTTTQHSPAVANSSSATMPSVPQTPGPSKPSTAPSKLTNVQRTDPALLAYVRQNFGSTNLSEEDWKKAEDHYKINLLYQDMLRKRQEIDRLAASGKFKYEYDSDEDTIGGTWEHKLRSQEMEATQLWANELTKKSEGKHHIGDFLPPEELRKFMEKYEAQKNSRQPNLSDYKEYKLKEDNVGFQMLQKLGWKDGQGLGADGSGIVEPINKASQRDSNQGLGTISADNPEVDDNEYDAYRKRMMLAYRFRPNPLNNPRRAYY